MIEFERIDDIEQANFLLNKCLNTIDELNNRIDEEKGRVQKYRETNTKLRSKHIELRDYFAAKAMQSFLTHEHLYLYDQAEKLCCGDWDDYVVETAYFVADKMMKARK